VEDAWNLEDKREGRGGAKRQERLLAAPSSYWQVDAVTEQQ
jgi:hypothetical protein